jgi:penicillin-binding protein 2
MFIFDQIKRSDRPLRMISFGVLAGMLVLLTGLWHVQIVSAKKFEKNLQTQSFRSVRVSALRGKIYDRNGKVLAENRPRYSVNLYLEELLAEFTYEYTNRVLPEFRRTHPTNRLTLAAIGELKHEARYRVVSNTTYRVTSLLGKPAALDRKWFARQYSEFTYVPFPVLANLTSNQVAIFAEQLSSDSRIELEMQPLRSYPNGSAAAHLLGYVKRKRERQDEEESFKYYLPYYAGQTGVERTFDSELSGQAGEKWVLVNSTHYRQGEEMRNPTKPGQDIFLTIDLAIQTAAEKALAGATANARGAAVVMDVMNGDVLAMASSPTYDPNSFVDGISQSDYEHLNDPTTKHMFNRATYGEYPPGSTFKIVTAIACLESGLDPKATIYNPGYYQKNNRSRPIDDTAPAGMYNFEKAFYHSSNTYFITNGLKAGLRKILEVGKRFHLGESTETAPRQEVAGTFPTFEEAAGLWQEGNTANLCIGQEITVTPIQMAALTAAIANGGNILWPRLVSYAKSPDDSTKEIISSPNRVRDRVQINPKHLETIRHAMLLDTEAPGANAYDAFHESDGVTLRLKEWHVAGKTGTAEIKPRPGLKDKVTWFVSFAPYGKPRYAVVVMVESGGSGGTTCATAAQKIYEAIIKREQFTTSKATIAKN